MMHMMMHILIAATCATAPLIAQVPVDSSRAASRDATRAERRWIEAGDARTLALFAAGAAAALTVDAHVARESQRASVHQHTTAANAASAVRTLGDPGVVVLSASTWILASVLRRRTVADAGLHALEAALVSGAVTGVLKGVIGRARPYVVHDTDARAFQPFHVNGAYASFPSGHTTVAFAAASATAAEIARSTWATQHRGAARTIATTLFAVAADVGVSRVYHDAHWTSDVIAGAGIGTVSGAILVRAQHDGLPTRVDRWLLPSSAHVSSREIGAVWSVSFR